MPKGFRHLGDPNIEAGSFKTIDDGDYVVNGIESFISKDDSGPFFKDVNGEMKVLLKLRLVTGDEEGPAISCTPAEFVALVQAFGGDFSDPEKHAKFKLTADNRMSSTALMIGQKSANAAGKRITVQSRNGWVNYMNQLTPPEGKYMVKFVTAHRPDRDPNNLQFQKINGSFGTFESLIFEFEIVGDSLGKPSVWDGYRFSEFLNNPFVKEYFADEGVEPVTARDEGCPLWKRDERNGGVPSFVKVWDEFIRFFAPEVLSYEWKTDPTDSSFGVCEVEEPQYVIVNTAKRSGRQVKVWYGKKQRSTRKGINLRDLPMLNDPPAEEEDAEEESTEQPGALLALVEYIEKRWPDQVIFGQSAPGDPSVVFTEVGKQWAKEYLGGDTGPWVRAGLNLNDRRLHILNEPQLVTLLTELEGQYGTLSDEAPW